MICNKCNRSNGLILASFDVICEVGLEDFDIGVVRLYKCLDLHLASVCAALSHPLQVLLPSLFGLIFCGSLEGQLRGEGGGILSFGVTAYAFAHGNEWFELVGILAHVLYAILADLALFLLVSIELIREGIEETIA